MATPVQVTLANPLSAAQAAAIGLPPQEYGVGVGVTLDYRLASILVNAGVARFGAGQVPAEPHDRVTRLEVVSLVNTTLQELQDAGTIPNAALVQAMIDDALSGFSPGGGGGAARGVWWTGTGPPPDDLTLISADARPGHFYLDTATDDLYVLGDAVNVDSPWWAGAGPPPADLTTIDPAAVAGDLYLDTTTADLYQL